LQSQLPWSDSLLLRLSLLQPESYSRLVTSPPRSRQALDGTIRLLPSNTSHWHPSTRQISCTERSLSQSGHRCIPGHLSFVQIRQSPPPPASVAGVITIAPGWQSAPSARLGASSGRPPCSPCAA